MQKDECVSLPVFHWPHVFSTECEFRGYELQGNLVRWWWTGGICQPECELGGHGLQGNLARWWMRDSCCPQCGLGGKSLAPRKPGQENGQSMLIVTFHYWAWSLSCGRDWVWSAACLL